MSNEREEQYRALAGRYGVSLGAVEVLAHALQTSGGKQAQFNHPELGGMGQWQPGMIMIGDMFNNGLKARVDALATELSKLITAPNSLAVLRRCRAFRRRGGRQRMARRTHPAVRTI